MTAWKDTQLLKNMKQEDKILITPKEAAKVFSCSIDFLTQLEKEKRIKVYTVRGKRLKRYRVAEIDKQFIPL